MLSEITTLQYIKIKNAIKEQIQSGQLAAGAKLPSERKLSESFKTTRVTLRESLSLLEADGLIYREDRRGWFIAHRALRLDLSVPFAFSSVAQAQGRSSRTELDVAESVMGNKESTQYLSLPPFTEVYAFGRIHYLDGKAVMYAQHYVRADRFPNLLQHPLDGDLSSLYREHWQLITTSCKYSVRSSTFDDDIASKIKATMGAPALRISKVNVDETGVAQEYVVEHWRHNAVTLDMAIEFTSLS
ncbi:UTRA domain-containing protein [Enterovibrio sp. ZSDZ42]|uniref:UTRA domain-containing protein n=1 Tax=Enterovibrio gelatinilyticus TaxID=2899819 RepID=A0ABT5R197_9GAMM|nr:UTRA domain-containing protein [Enterovibrio sp. ZSDZ42]MDD1794045.1 UTRA domain-containing protein [Enterovibrio sp. ZSDZ42]